MGGMLLMATDRIIKKKRYGNGRGSARPTLADVARLAEVSTATVSMVVNRLASEIPVGRETRQRVLNAVKQLGYEPNLLARSLKTQRTSTVGLVVADIRDPFFGEIVRGVEETLHEAGFVYILSSANNKSDFEGFNSELFNQMRVDGIIVAGLTTPAQNKAVLSMVERGVPIAAISSNFPRDKVPQVALDYVSGVKSVMRHFFSLGHSRIAYIAGPHQDVLNQLSIEAFIDAYREAGVVVDRDLIIENDFEPRNGYEDMQRLLDLKKPPTAVYCCQNAKAMGAMRALWERDIRIPDRISMVAIDANNACEYTTPPLTALQLPRYEMGFQATKMLLKMLSEPDWDGEHFTVLQPQLILRASTGPCPK